MNGGLFYLLYFLLFYINSYADCSGLNSPIFASKTIAFVGEEIVFHANLEVDASLIWHFGDGTYITGVQNPSYSYLDTGNYVVTLIKSNGFFSDTQKLDIKIVLPTELLEVNKNPIVGKDYIEIYEPSGKIVYSGILTNLIIVPSNFGLTSGYYIVCIKNNYTIKIIKQINVSK